MVVEIPDFLGIKPLLIDLERGPGQEFGRQVLDGEADGLRSAIESPVADRLAPRRPRPAREELGFGGVVELFHTGSACGDTQMPKPPMIE